MAKREYLDMSNIKAKPFLKWAGGKSQLLQQIEKHLPKDIGENIRFTYVEPFVGGGAMLFYMLQKYPNIFTAVINDKNKDLINCYNVIKNSLNCLIGNIEGIKEEYLKCLNLEQKKNNFLSLREQYNYTNLNPIERASFFIALNHLCFNGLYRVNKKGLFNSPFGYYERPLIYNKENLQYIAKLLQKVDILSGDFSETLPYASPNTLFYLDPPYRPITKTSSFTGYTKDGFDDIEQTRLKNFCDELNSNGSRFVLSNSDSTEAIASKSFFSELYAKYKIHKVLAHRNINSNGKKRNKISEILICNY